MFIQLKPTEKSTAAISPISVDCPQIWCDAVGWWQRNIDISALHSAYPGSTAESKITLFKPQRQFHGPNISRNANWQHGIFITMKLNSSSACNKEKLILSSIETISESSDLAVLHKNLAILTLPS